MQRAFQPQYLVCLGSFLSLHDVKFNIVAFLQAFIPFSLNRGVVYEHIRAIVAPNEPESFCIIEPLHFAFMLRHGARTSPIQIGNHEGTLPL